MGGAHKNFFGVYQALSPLRLEKTEEELASERLYFEVMLAL